jgi:hypothetical protein
VKSLCGLYDLSDLVRLCLSLEILDVDPGIALPGCFEDVMAAFYSRFSEECSAYKLQLRKLMLLRKLAIFRSSISAESGVIIDTTKGIFKPFRVPLEEARRY